MTDKVKLINLLNDFGIPFTLRETTGEFENNNVKYASSIEFGSGIGYIGFVDDFYFDKDGKFVTHGVWE